MKGVIGGRGCLFVVAVAVGSTYAVFIYGRYVRGAPAVLIGLGLALLYTVAAAWVVRICEVLRAVAFPEDREEWDGEIRAFLGAFWPLSLSFWIIMAIFFGIINRLFP